MKSSRLPFALSGLLAVAASSAALGSVSAQSRDREEAYRRNNIGVALLEQFRYQDATEAFRRALEVDGTLSIARFNFAIALYHVPDLPGSLREARTAAEQLPESPHPSYLLGLIAKAENRSEDALAAFSRVVELDPGDVGANVNLGQLLVQLRRYDEAIAALRRGMDAEPFNATAVYSLGMALTRAGDRDAGRQMIERFQELRASGYGTLLGQSYLEQGRYAEAIASTGAESELVDHATPKVRFRDATREALGDAAGGGPAPPAALGRELPQGVLEEAVRREVVAGLGGQLLLFDPDGDGDLDLLAVGPEGRRLLVNDGGRFRDGTAAAGLEAGRPGLAAIAGDYDNDEREDLYVFEPGAGTLYHNDGGGAFSEVSSEAGLAPAPYLSLSGAFTDADHDGDLDLLLAGFVDLAAAGAGGAFPAAAAPAPDRLFRNDGDGTFTEISAEAGLSANPARTIAAVPTDYDNRRDVDFFLVQHGAAPRLARNVRDGTFRDVAGEAGLARGGRFTAAAAGDVNKDGYTDFFLAEADGPGLLAFSDGQLRFALSPGPDGAAGAQAAQFLDYDNDGLLDLVVATAAGPGVFRNLGSEFEDVTSAAVERGGAAPAGRLALAAGDLDGDGDHDLVVRDAAGRLRVWRNEGGEAKASVSVRLAGRISNRSGVGAKLELRAGSLSQKLETYAATPAPAPADVVFGLGSRDGADAVRVLWPAGILQTEIGGETPGSRVASRLEVEELDRKPSSCPYLYAWNGSGFTFVTDFMGGGEMGYWAAPGVRNHPDPVEYVRIAGDQLVAHRGRYLLRITNELEEALFFDGLRLHVISHPAGVQVHPNEGMVSFDRSHELYAVSGARLPLSAVDGAGRDVLSVLRRIDREFVEGFALLPIRGYAEEHELVLDLGPGTDEAVLLLNGWTDYAFSSDNVAASQRGLAMAPPRLEVRDGEGRWRTAIAQVGIPVGRPQTVAVDLAGRWLGPSREVRIVTNMRIYWDQALVAPARQQADRVVETVVLEPASAELRWRGFSAEVTPDGRQPFVYDYASVSWSSPWKVFPGRYTREGDVRELMEPGDDRYVISRPGDEIAVSFDAAGLPELRPGWARTFLLYTDGFSKEMDINSSNPHQLGPLPFHGMTRYPYGPEQSYPLTPERLDYMERYNTRVVGSPLPALEWDVVASQRESRGAASEPAGEEP